MKISIKWRIQPQMGPGYKYSREWPTAEYPDGNPAARVGCEDDYTTEAAHSGRHAPLTLYVADHSQQPWNWHSATERFDTLTEAKEAAWQLIARNPHMRPTE
jgi:hypothetical protein